MPGLDLERPFIPVGVVVLTISDSRTAETDTSGDTLAERVGELGHPLIGREIVTDDLSEIQRVLLRWCSDARVNVIITTGGTGVTGRDVTPEAVEAISDKRIPGFGELFRQLSYRSVGTSTVQSRACAGVRGDTYVFALPGSTGACRDAWDGILKTQLDSRFRPCNFIELIPRLGANDN